MRGGLIHDAGYQLLRMNLLPRRSKELIDESIRQYHLAGKIMKFRANYFNLTVDKFGEPSALPSHRGETLYSP